MFLPSLVSGLESVMVSEYAMGHRYERKLRAVLVLIPQIRWMRCREYDDTSFLAAVRSSRHLGDECMGKSGDPEAM